MFTSWLNKSVMSSTESTESNKSSAIHNCVDSECDGASHGGLKLECSWCHQPTFLSCLLHRNEFKRLLSAVFPKGLSDQISQTHCVSLNEAFKSLFDPESTISFRCFECKTRGSFGEVEKTHGTALIDAKKGANNHIGMLKQQHAAALDTRSNQLALANTKIEELKNTSRANVDESIGKILSLESLLTDMIASSESQSHATVIRAE